MAPSVKWYPVWQTNLELMRALPLLIMFLALVSCRTSRLASTAMQNERDSVYVEIEKLVPVPVPTDSAAIRALLECDENGKVVLKWLDMANTKNVELQFLLDSLGNLMTNFKVPPDTVYLPSKETSISTNKKKVETKIVEVDRPLTKWQRFCNRFTTVILIVSGISLILFVRSKLRGLWK